MSRVCLACRHPVPRDACDQPGPGHDVVDLDRGSDRLRLVEATWGGQDDRRQRARWQKQKTRASTAVGMSTAIASGIATAFVIGPSKPLILAASALFGTMAAGLSSIVQSRRDDDRFPLAAAPPPPASPFARGTIVDGGTDLRSPVSDLWGPAWAIALTFARKDGARVVFRDSASSGLAIRLDDGTRARVAHGPWRPAGELVHLLDIDEGTETAHLRAIDRAYQPHDELGPFHHDAVHEALLRVGDRVELFGEWRPVPQTGDQLYRDAPPIVLVPDAAWPTLRRL